MNYPAKNNEASTALTAKASLRVQLSNLNNIPADLRTHKNFLCWQLTPSDDGRLQKRPYNPTTGTLASCDDPATWVDYDTARAAVESGLYESIGFALTKEVRLGIVDLDKVRQTQDDDFPEWVLELVEKLDSYTEISASGRGLHILVWNDENLSNINRQSQHAEIWSCDKMFALSGNVFEGRDVIQRRSLTVVHKQIEENKLFAEKPLVIEYGSQRFRDICNDDWTKHELDSRSAAVASALVSLAHKYKFDAEEMRAEFEKTALCAAWEEKGKWTRLGEREIARAIEFAKANPRTEVKEHKKPFIPKGPRVEGGDEDYVVGNSEFEEGWFPRGDVSLIAAYSGGGKSTWAIDMLEQQIAGKPFYGRPTFKLPYLILMADRGQRSLRRTAKRMRIDLSKTPYELLSGGVPLPQAVETAMLKQPILPAVVFMEGIDLAHEGDVSDAQDVRKTLRDLGELCDHYHIALIGTTGAPKVKAKDSYRGLREMVLGSGVWSRMTETLVVFQKENGKETCDVTVMTALPRQSKPLEYKLRFRGGRLEEIPEAELKAQEESKTDSSVLEWILGRESFTLAQFRKAFPKLNGRMQRKKLDGLTLAGMLKCSKDKYTLNRAEADTSIPWDAEDDETDVLEVA